MPSGGDDLSRLSDELADLVAADVPELIAEARAEARTRVRAVLVEAMAEAMLARARRPRDMPADTRGPEPRPVAPMPIAAEPGREEPAGLAQYVYGVTAAGRDQLPEMGGVDPGHPVGLIAVDDLAALVSAVPLSEFNEQRLREHLEDLGWVETVARRHEDVLERAAEAATVVPMRLCSIFRDPAGVEQMLRRESTAMRGALALLGGRSEWGVKAFAVGASPPEDDGTRTEPASGAAYLELRRASQRRRADAGDAVAEACGAVHERLSAIAVQDRVLPAQRPEVSGHPGSMVLNGVYLVDHGALERFHAAFAALQAQVAEANVELVATGPWPAYNFVPDAIGTTP